MENPRLAPVADEAAAGALLNTVQCGDCAAALKQPADASVDAVITSPPYFQQRDYAGLGMGNEARVEDYLENLLAPFAEVVRVTKPSGNIVYNIGDKYQKISLLLAPYRAALAITQRFSLRLVNEITWVKRNPTPRQFNRRLVSATEPFFHFAKTADYYYDRDSFQMDRAQQKLPLRARDYAKLGDGYRKTIREAALSDEQKARWKAETAAATPPSIRSPLSASWCACSARRRAWRWTRTWVAAPPCRRPSGRTALSSALTSTRSIAPRRGKN